ncbi:MAG: tRNA uracil 4-sulfurtransferase ThiI [Coriobacteriia bacterium]|nr:tRNA uracil 4-sulfurtransferase ThiI [Coriobacteriia bacterium]
MFQRAALVHYHEIGLKGRNRAKFERRLRDNLEVALGDLAPDGVQRISSRLLVRADRPEALEQAVDIIAITPGVSSVSPCWVTSREDHDIERAALLAVEEDGPHTSFAVKARRSNTDHPISSLEMNRRIGRRIQDATGMRVDLSNPDFTVSIEVVGGEVYVYGRKIPGAGGLPVGSAGTVISLLSAGIDSPVATWRTAKRGATVVAVHFSGRPQVADMSERLVLEIGAVLERRGAIGRIYIVPFGDLQREIALAAPPALRVLLYRRLMVRVAEAVAHIEGGAALVTGESLGQVASQTLENIAAVDDATNLPVLRPLIGMDKVEIIAEACALETFDISIQEHDDCCTLFMPRSPATRASVADVIAGEADLDMNRMVADALHSMTYRDFSCPSYRPPRRLPSGVVPAS